MKKILILGGNYSTVDVVQTAKQLGYYTIVASNSEKGEAKDIADETLLVDLEDYESLVRYIKNNNVDGIMTGPSEFHTLNMIRLNKLTGLPSYVNEEQWNICQNKDSFKKLCRKYNVPSVPEYDANDVSIIPFPVIIKPVDGCSSKGITLCKSPDTFERDLNFAKEYSLTRTALVEKYIDSKGYGASARYIASNGIIKLSLVGDRYICDTEHAMISSVAIFPSKWTRRYIEKINDNVIEMFKSIGINNGTFFMQALPENDFYFHEMGLRLSGGLSYKITEPINGINDLKMMIKYAMGEEFASEEEIAAVDPYLHGKYAGILSIPLAVGKIDHIEGLEDIRKRPEITSIVEYYYEGGVVEEKYIGTLLQLYARFKFVTNTYDEIVSMINYIQDTLKITSDKGENMIYKYFDVNRLK